MDRARINYGALFFRQFHPHGHKLLMRLDATQTGHAVGFIANFYAQINYTNSTEPQSWRSLKFTSRLIAHFVASVWPAINVHAIVDQMVCVRTQRFVCGNRMKIKSKQKMWTGKTVDRKPCLHKKHTKNGTQIAKQPKKGVKTRLAFVNLTPFYLFNERFPRRAFLLYTSVTT